MSGRLVEARSSRGVLRESICINLNASPLNPSGPHQVGLNHDDSQSAAATKAGGLARLVDVTTPFAISPPSRLDIFQLIEQGQELLHFLRAKLFLDFLVVALHALTHGNEALLAALRERDENAPLILTGLLPTDEAIALQTIQDAGHARLENAGLMRKLVAFKFALLAQYPNDPPLLFGQVMLVQCRSEKSHCGFASLQQGQCQ